MPRYLMLLYDTPADYADLSPQEVQAMIERYSRWSAGLKAEGKSVKGEKLTDDGGRRLKRSGDKVVAVDGPYAEAKDVIGGYYLIEAADRAEAEAIARTCPHLHGRNWIELREIEPT
jgi:hypothetical protein